LSVTLYIMLKILNKYISINNKLDQGDHGKNQ